jgi:AGZA family xanthine/uracil permease-like MFS transporter
MRAEKIDARKSLTRAQSGRKCNCGGYPAAMDAELERPQPWFASGDLDGFFGLAVDNLIQFLLIVALSVGVLGFSPERVLGTLLPGAALSILIGNVFYAHQSRRLSAQTGRSDVCALPYGINTVSLFAYVFLVMLPVKLAAIESGESPAQAAETAWRVGLAACLISGLIETAGAFVGDWIRRVTPRAALLSTLAGIAISFIAIDFAVQTFESPLVAILPLAVILATYFGQVKMPARIPGGAVAVLLGAGAAWLLAAADRPEAPVAWGEVLQATASVGLHLPVPMPSDVVLGLSHPLFWSFLVPVMLPMGLFNVLGSLQNIESAEAAGDGYEAFPALAMNGGGSLVAALFGSCFPTTIYIGHPGWKGLGARSGYSILNGVFFALVAFGGLTSLIAALIPMQAGIAIVLWIGIIITAQAFQATPAEQAPAVAIGLFPAIAAWGVLVLGQTLNAAGNALGNPGLAAEVLLRPDAFLLAGAHLPGLVALSQGFMLTCMVWAATSAELIQKRLERAAIWLFVGAGLSLFGFIHAGSLGPAGGEFDIGFGSGWRWSVGYGLSAAFLLVVRRSSAS